MAISSSRWKAIGESHFDWEQKALAFLKERLPDQEPYRAWTNFDFIAEDGSIYEVDLLILTPLGFYLVEVKSRPGALEGDAHTWIWTHEGRRTSMPNPLLLANTKAKKLISLLKRQKALSRMWVPFLEPIVFCSAVGLKCNLDPSLTSRVLLSDPSTPGIVRFLTAPPGAESDYRHIDSRLARAIGQAVEQAGIRPSERWRRIGDYELQELVSERAAYQDWRAVHVSVKDIRRRVHLYPVKREASKEHREVLRRAAEREFRILEGVNHQGILRAIDLKESERGPAVFFDDFPGALRLDLFLAQQAEMLSVDVRLSLMRQIAEAVRYAHEKKIAHRSLSPQSVLIVDAESKEPITKLFDWQTGYRERPLAETPDASSVSPTSHVGELVEGPATAYIAPEVFTDPHGSGEQADVFSLGALAFHLFSGKSPASSQVELHEKLREGRGLQISSVLDGAGKELQFLVEASTNPDLANRLGTAAEFLEQLDAVVEELTRPETGIQANPLEAGPGDQLEHGFKVARRLGRGSVSTTFLVQRNGKESVLKIASDPEDSITLESEAEVLGKLRHPAIVELYAKYTFGDRVALHMQRAGDTTLGQMIRKHGKLQLDLLERLGTDLLSAIAYLEREGIAHRDIKPDNIGVGPVGKDKQLHLIMFDFSLSRAPVEQIRVGTRPYLEPFLPLRKPPRWDTYAERFAAAVTLYEMATGTLPRWDERNSDPALLDCEVTLDTELFEANVRESLAALFEKALQGDFA
jgi:serine/threonine protein kinase